MIRTIVGGLILTILLGLLYVYFYGMQTGCFGNENDTKVYYLAGMAEYTLYLLIVKPIVTWEIQFTQVGKSAMFIFFLVGLLNNSHLLLISPYSLMMQFTGLFFVTTAMILYFGRRHGLFNE